jgi:hypothetical protein
MNKERKMTKLTHEDAIDLIEEAIADSMDLDWTPKHAARLVVRALLAEGALRIHSVPDASMDAMLDEVFVAALRRAGA